MQKFCKRALVLLIALLLIVSQLSAISATVKKASDGTLYWEMTNKQFVSKFNEFCEQSDRDEYIIDKYSKKSFTVPYSESLKFNIYTTDKGYVRKINIKLTEDDYSSGYKMGEILSCVSVIFLNNEKDLRAMLKNMSDIASDYGNSSFNETFIIKKCLFTFKCDVKKGVLEYTIAPTSKADRSYKK